MTGQQYMPQWMSGNTSDLVDIDEIIAHDDAWRFGKTVIIKCGWSSREFQETTDLTSRGETIAVNWLDCWSRPKSHRKEGEVRTHYPRKKPNPKLHEEGVHGLKTRSLPR
jgi:hypothetical protein